MEIWKDIKDYEGHFKISNIGRVRSVTRTVINSLGVKHILSQRIIKPYLNLGYMQIILTKAKVRRTIKVHRLVAMAFIDNPENKKTVNHINGIGADNRVGNLEWNTQKENVIHSWKTGLSKRKLTHENVIEIRSKKGINTQAELAKQFGICVPEISRIHNRKRWWYI